MMKRRFWKPLRFLSLLCLPLVAAPGFGQPATNLSRITASQPPTNMVLIPAGSFTMGDSLDRYNLALPAHTVSVSAFYMDRTEVTKALWDEVRTWANTHGYDLNTVGLGKATNHPVHSVNWNDCVKWCNARSEKEGRVPAYYREPAQTNVYRTGVMNIQNDSVKWTTSYRLPTEAEWEYAARGGASGRRFPWTDTDTITHSRANYYSTNAHYLGVSSDVSPTRGYHPGFQAGGMPYTSPAGYFAQNGYGLYDMAGNVWEWCWDGEGSYPSSSQSDPRGPPVLASFSFRMIRGGAWSSFAFDCRSAGRGLHFAPADRASCFGFRAVLAPDHP